MGAMGHIFLDSLKILVSMVLIFYPASTYNPPTCSPADSNRLYKFTDRKLPCGPDAAAAHLRCRLAVKNLLASNFIGGSHPFPPRCFQDGFYEPHCFFRPHAIMRIERRRSTFALPSCCRKSLSIEFHRLQPSFSSPLLPGRIL